MNGCKYDETGVQFLLAIWELGGVGVRCLGGWRVRSEGTPQWPDL